MFTAFAVCLLHTGVAGAPRNFEVGGALVRGDEALMSPKAHGTTAVAVQAALRWDVSRETADNICSFNRRYAERAGYFEHTDFYRIAKSRERKPQYTFYDSVSAKPLFVAPVGRSMAAFLRESEAHGWPSFRDEEVVWANMRVLEDGEAVSVDGTHLGHNLPDQKGNRYCINLVSVAGQPPQKLEL